MVEFPDRPVSTFRFRWRRHRNEVPGVIRRKHPSDFEEFWWTLPEATYFECQPSCSFLIRKSAFRGAEWDGDTLLVDVGAIIYRIVPLVRTDDFRAVSLVRHELSLTSDHA